MKRLRHSWPAVFPFLLGWLVFLPACDQPSPRSRSTPGAERTPRAGGAGGVVGGRGPTYPKEPPPTVAIKKLRILPDNQHIVTMDTDRVTLWDMSKTYKYRRGSNEPLDTPEFVVKPARMYDFDVSPDGTRVLTGSSDGVMRIIDLATGRQLDAYKMDDKFDAYLVAFRADATQAVTLSGTGNKVRIWDLRKHELIEEFIGPGTDQRTPLAVFSPERTRLLATGSDRDTAAEFILEADPNQSGAIARAGKSMKRGRSFSGYKEGITRLNYFDGGSKASVEIGAKKTEFWNMTTGECIRTVLGLRVAIVDGATCYRVRLKEPAEGFLRGFDIVGLNWQTDKATEEFPGPEILPFAMGLSRDGRYLAIGGKRTRQLREEDGFVGLSNDGIDRRALEVYDRERKKWHMITGPDWQE